MAESLQVFAAEPMALFEDADQLIADEYFNNRQTISTDSEHSSSDENEEDISATQATFMDPRELDLEEVGIIKQFSTATCKCTKRKGGPCSTYFNVEEFADHRMQMAELENESLDMIILSQINAHHFSETIRGHRGTATANERLKEYTTFYCHGYPICLETFLFYHGIGKKRFRNLLKHYKLNGLSPRMHGNRNRKPWNAAKFEDKESAVKFITNYAEVNALPLPGRMPRFNDYDIMLLPSDTTKASVHRKYVSCTEELQKTSGKFVRCFGYREFCRLWSEVVPFIRTMPPAEDICHICQENATRIMQSANCGEDEKRDILLAAEEHLKCAKKQRCHYQKQVQESQENIKNCTLASLSYSFDHAQQVHYPSNPQQPGPIYFKVPRKCGIFGVCDEGNSSQINYLIDEAQSCGKGANSIVSMVHHFLQYFTHGEGNVLLHADNCVGQNKNNTMIQYLSWRVITGLSVSCELSFMIPGHTKFSPDRFFGMIKRKYRRTKVDSLIQLAEMVNSSTIECRNTAYIVGHDTSKPFFHYNWTELLQTHFNTLPKITSYHHFRFCNASPGNVFVREFADDQEVELRLLKMGHQLTKEVLPATLSPTGLSREREIYLYEHIRPFCQLEYRDLTCPVPQDFQRQENEMEQHDMDVAPKSGKRLCSHCRLPGHTKTKRGKITCPKLL